MKSTERNSDIRGFWALIATQFQGAFNDNAFKTLITLYLLAVYTDERVRRYMIPLAMALFTVPYLLFSIYAGALADRNSKKRVIVWTKWLEIVVMVAGLTGFLLRSPAMLLVTLFLMATQSALFSPAKYGILPELLSPRRLSWGNGIIQMGTFVAIITGTAISGVLMDTLDGRIYLASVFLVILSAAGLAISFGITRPPAADPGRRISWWPWADMGRYMNLFFADRWLLLTMLGIAYFWFMGALVHQNIFLFGKETLDLTDTYIGLLLTSVAVGIGTGSVAAGYLSGGKIEVGLIPLGAVALAVFSALLAVPDWEFPTILFLLFCLGFSSGFYIVPLSANLQHRSPDTVKGGMIATTNFFTFAGMTLSAGTFYLLATTLRFSPHRIFLVSAVMTVAVSGYICGLLPVFLVRFLLWLLTHTMYRIRVDGRRNIPQEGGALFVSNHMSTVDALLVMASTDRLVRFIMVKGFYDRPLVHPLAKVLKGIPIASGGELHETAAALATAREAVRNGEIVCIFAEGQITHTGHLLPFRGGFERIMHDIDAPIIPVCLDRIWGSIFSYAEGRSFWRMPHRFRRRITVTYGTPMSARSSAVEVRAAVQELATRAFAHRKPDQPLLHRGFVAAARRHPWRLALADSEVAGMSFFRALVDSIVLARKLKPLLGPERMVGIMLPHSVRGVLCNVALELMGKVPVNLDHGTPGDVLASAVRRCGLHHVVTSRAVIESGSVNVPAQTVCIEDVFDTFNIRDSAAGLVLAVFCPVRWIERLAGAHAGRTQDDLCTVMFTGGTSGEPKGVMLSHYNVTSNIEGIAQVFALGPGDRVLGVVPLSHSFGFTCTLWLPLTMGVGVVYHPDLTDARSVGAVARRYGVTVLVATATMIETLVEHCPSKDFGSVAYVIVGAEHLSDRVSSAFEDKFGIRPYEGYGCTECAPVVAVNVPDFRAPGFYQVGHKRGRIGHPLPGVTVRIVDPDTFRPLPTDTPGLLLVKGPNVMTGYLDDPEATAEVLRDGWYVTGDIATVDQDGFLNVTGRISGFSKIGGETVPHRKVEQILHELVGLTDRKMVVVGVADPEQGEHLVVLHTLEDDQLDEVKSRLAESGLPEHWRPHSSAFHRIQSIPLLPSGKVDLHRLKEFAEWLQ